MTQTIAAAEFKATCLAVLDAVADSAEEFVITKRGRPVARLVPIRRATRSLVGSAKYDTLDDLLSPTGDSWDADR